VSVPQFAIACCVAACARPVPVPEGAATMSIPTGVWQRDWIQRHGGALDRSVTVRYVQTPSVFGDVRIPVDRAGAAQGASFADLTDDQLAVLARQNGFAGTTTVAGANATWHHEIDFQPAGDDADIGRIEPAGDGRMFEHGLDGSYVESWSAVDPMGEDPHPAGKAVPTPRDSALPIARGDGRFFAVRVAREGRVDQLLAVAGGHFVYARARPSALPAGRSIADVIVQAHATREMIAAYLDCEISSGTVAGWRIERSTLPWREGERLAFADQIVLDPSDQPAPRAAAAGETWSFPVGTLGAAELRTMFASRPGR
jgi:hypothetical protein